MIDNIVDFMVLIFIILFLLLWKIYFVLLELNNLFFIFCYGVLNVCVLVEILYDIWI